MILNLFIGIAILASLV